VDSFPSTILDRLAFQCRSEMTFAQYREVVQRDLHWLFNSVNSEDPLGPPTDPADARWRDSVVNFGIPSLTGQVLRDITPAQVEAVFATAIRRFEPRIFPRGLKVTCRTIERESGEPVLRIAIEAELWAQPVSERVFLHSEIDTETGGVRIEAVDEPDSRGGDR
jgi:type VI secretion system protein ImpF